MHGNLTSLAGKGEFGLNRSMKKNNSVEFFCVWFGRNDELGKREALDRTSSCRELQCKSRKFRTKETES